MQMSYTYSTPLKTSCSSISLNKISLHPMDSNSSSYLLNPSAIQSVYYHHNHHQQQQQQQANEDHNNGVIDLGLSLRTLQPKAYHPSGQCMSL